MLFYIAKFGNIGAKFACNMDDGELDKMILTTAKSNADRLTKVLSIGK